MGLIAGDWRGCSGRKINVAMEQVWSSVRKVIEGVRHPRVVSPRVKYGISLRPTRATKIVYTCHSMPWRCRAFGLMCAEMLDCCSGTE